MTNKFKKILAAALTIAFMFSLASCGNSNATAPSSVGPSAPPVISTPPGPPPS